MNQSQQEKNIVAMLAAIEFDSNIDFASLENRPCRKCLAIFALEVPCLANIAIQRYIIET